MRLGDPKGQWFNERRHEVTEGATLPRSTCPHDDFQVDAAVTRLTDADDGPVTGYTMDVRVHCRKCGVAFRFMGLPFGSHFAEPRRSADSQELRAPIEPALVTEVLGRPIVSGRA